MRASRFSALLCCVMVLAPGGVRAQLQDLDSLDQFDEPDTDAPPPGATPPGAPSGTADTPAEGTDSGATADPNAATDPDAAAPPSENVPSEGGTAGRSGKSRALPSKPTATSPAVAAPGGRTAAVPRMRPRALQLSFGLQAGNPFGLQLQGRLFNRVAFNGSLGFDLFFRGLVTQVDARVTMYEMELVSYDTTIAFWAGLGARVAMMEPWRRYRRDFWGFGFGAHVPLGVSIKMEPLPMEWGAWISPLSFDFNSLSQPRWRPSAVVEARFLLPWSPF